MNKLSARTQNWISTIACLALTIILLLAPVPENQFPLLMFLAGIMAGMTYVMLAHSLSLTFKCVARFFNTRAYIEKQQAELYKVADWK